MLRYSAVIMLFCIVIPGMHAGGPLFVPLGADKAAMAYTGVASSDHWSGFYNQALMAGQTSFSAAFAIESPFTVAEMSEEALSLILPVNNTPLGLVVSHFGNGQYSMIFGGIGSAVNIAEGFSAGIQADFISQRGAGDYSDKITATFEAGLAARLTPRIMFGIHVVNPLSSFNSLPSSLRAGIAWRLSPDFLFAFETSKVTEEPLTLHIGLDWLLKSKIALRAGYLSSPSSLTFGTGFIIGPLQADTGFIINQRTGVTPSLSFILTMKKK
jgi:hypothetical protein